MENFEKVQCENCGSTLKIENNMDFAVCPHCQTTYVRKHGSANVSGTSSLEQLLSAGEVFLKKKEWKTAYDYFSKAQNYYSTDYRVYWGLFRAFTQNMTNCIKVTITRTNSNDEQYWGVNLQSWSILPLESLSDYGNRAVSLASEKERRNFAAECESYLRKVYSLVEEEKNKERKKRADRERKADEAKKKDAASRRKQEGVIARIHFFAVTVPLIAYGIFILAPLVLLYGALLRETVLGYIENHDIFLIIWSIPLGLGLLFLIYLLIPIKRKREEVFFRRESAYWDKIRRKEDKKLRKELGDDYYK